MTAPAADRIDEIVDILDTERPAARYELDWTTPLQMLIATILAAQCTDERVNKVTAEVFPCYADASAWATCDRETLEEQLKPTGFFRNKAKAVQEVCAALVEHHGGEVPRSMDALVALPGVARKTANVVLATVWNDPSGVIVDTHVKRVCQRLGLTAHKDGLKIERELMALVREELWTWFGPATVLHGRYVCTARKPRCEECALAEVCPKIGV